ncbi:hypothetical protein LTR99_003984 [Exophiala xenobiotica]|uniref:Arrestin-like N-terminal domain-containing protein n=1 Tax=Vermiconidia calcicola TaxID=1690605 RepID=A0AAV9PU73_9PEZI|nr:hypothetical protein LTR96_006312 [Exophiala xenobiotica]KAK5529698.1 hypothetical protein LTR25_009477 [Vermiconidia calcicola]KAK5549098.1 hypothetical protein LTR23_000928 [Chaetothyriales sp. CCFEE 6169]KAK5304918.1 hypothetical protein LTR99_003984 [Exophiala xenobiotica]KAK5336799.1 hypothetical protein LTR98_007105 [Exophiala xenobiotica]
MRSNLAGGLNRRKHTDVIRLVVEGHEINGHKTYTTNDRVNGRVLVRFSKPTYFSSFSITLEGQTKLSLRIDPYLGPIDNPWSCTHTFLVLLDPSTESTVPGDGIALANVTYEMPFTFIVPQRLLPYACDHPVLQSEIRDIHLRLPPTFNNNKQSVSGEEGIAPSGVAVSYVVKFTMSKTEESSGSHMEVTSHVAPINILPSEEGTLAATWESSSTQQLELRRVEKWIRSGIPWPARSGYLVAEASTIPPLCVPPPGLRKQASISSMTKVRLFYRSPKATDHPPALQTLSGSIRGRTFLGHPPFAVIPNESAFDAKRTSHTCHTKDFQLFSRSIGTTQWDLCEDNASTPYNTCRPSLKQERGRLENMSKTKETYLWTAILVVPVDIPQGKFFVPTFHSCTLSQTYEVNLTISYSIHFLTIKHALQLSLPLQIVAAQRSEAISIVSDSSPAYEEAPAGADTSSRGLEHWTHGSYGAHTSTPDVGQQGASVLPPYSRPPRRWV